MTAQQQGRWCWKSASCAPAEEEPAAEEEPPPPPPPPPTPVHVATAAAIQTPLSDALLAEQQQQQQQQQRGRQHHSARSFLLPTEACSNAGSNDQAGRFYACTMVCRSSMRCKMEYGQPCLRSPRQQRSDNHSRQQPRPQKSRLQSGTQAFQYSNVPSAWR